MMCVCQHSIKQTMTNEQRSSGHCTEPRALLPKPLTPSTKP